MSMAAMPALLASAMLAGPSDWELISTPTFETLNGISSSSPDFAIAVGNAGAIVHFLGNDSGTLVSSGTDVNLFDVYTSAPDRAVAGGEDLVLHWDGSAWSPLVESMVGNIYTPVWENPEQNTVFYGAPGGFSLVCRADSDTGGNQACRTFVDTAMAFCGSSDDTKVILDTGAIWHIDNFLSDPVDPLSTEPLVPRAGLDLSAVWVPPGACLPGPFAPTRLFGINIRSQFYEFSDGAWSFMGVTVPAQQTMSWLTGSGPDNVIAGGFEPMTMKGPDPNRGVIWLYDGNSWQQDGTLPPGTPGLADVDYAYEFSTLVFENGFEAVAVGKSDPVSGESVRLRGASEGGATISNSRLGPNRRADFEMTVTPVAMTPAPGFQLALRNNGPDTASANYVLLGGANNLRQSTCPNSEIEGSLAGPRAFGSLTMTPGQEVLCFLATAQDPVEPFVYNIQPIDATDPNCKNNSNIRNRQIRGCE
ncbi:MAG: hypothetical protein QNJ40_05900 [Xanthomonadales bacterium]|nr:hypothetical protein [Xanthomonadales bacterium]